MIPGSDFVPSTYSYLVEVKSPRLSQPLDSSLQSEGRDCTWCSSRECEDCGGLSRTCAQCPGNTKVQETPALLISKNRPALNWWFGKYEKPF